MELDINELMELIEWCKKTGVKRLKLADTEFEMSDMALAEKYADVTEEATKEPLKDRESSSLSSKTLVDTIDAKELGQEDEELLYWSSHGR
jgi:hypothetical protein